MYEHESLETLAAEIVKHADQADDHIIEAAMLVRQARERVKAGEAGEVTWAAWARQRINLGESRIRELQRIAYATDPRAELERIRAMNRERAAKFREESKSRASSPDPEDRRYVTSVEPEASDPGSVQDGASAPEPQPKRTAARERAKFADLGKSLITNKPTIASFEKASETPSEAGLVVLLADVDVDGTTHVKSFIIDKTVRDLALSVIGKAHDTKVSDAGASSVSEIRSNAINEAIEDVRSKDTLLDLEAA